MKEIDKGILLRKINYSDTSLIVTVYTFSRGIQTFIFQGGKKRSHALYPMSQLEIDYYKRPDSELGKLTNVQLIKGPSEIPFHPVRSAIAFFMADVLYQCLKTDQADRHLFEFLEEQIEELDQTKEMGLIPLFFLIRLTKMLGIEPIIVDKNAVYFDPVEGEFREHHGFGSKVVSGKEINLLISIFQQQETICTHRETRALALNIILRYFEIHIPSFNINRSLGVLKELLD